MWKDTLLWFQQCLWLATSKDCRYHKVTWTEQMCHFTGMDLILYHLQAVLKLWMVILDAKGGYSPQIYTIQSCSMETNFRA